MNNFDFLEELTEVEETTIQGGRTTVTDQNGNSSTPLGNSTQPWGAYVSFPLAAVFPDPISFGNLFTVTFSVDQMSDVPTNNVLSGPFGALMNGLAGAFGLRTSAFRP